MSVFGPGILGADIADEVNHRHPGVSPGVSPGGSAQQSGGVGVTGEAKKGAIRGTASLQKRQECHRAILRNQVHPNCQGCLRLLEEVVLNWPQKSKEEKNEKENNKSKDITTKNSNRLVTVFITEMKFLVPTS